MKLDKVFASLEQDIQQDSNIDQSGAMTRLKDVASLYAGGDMLISSDYFLELIKNGPEERTMLTGFTELDTILGGFRESQLVILTGITKHGKTTMAIELTVRLKNEHPMWLPFEEPAIELVRKFYERNEAPPLFYSPMHMTGNDLSWVEAKIVESIVKYNTKVVFIDHLGFLQDSERSHNDENMAYKIERIVRALKQMAVRWKVTIVLLCHLSKTKIDTNPSFDDLKGSSAIAQEADTVMILWRKTKREHGKIVITNATNLSIQANRRTGKTGNVLFAYDNGRFIENEWLENEAQVEVW